MIGPVSDYRNIYVASCGQQFTSSALGRDHEKSCPLCAKVDSAADYSLAGVFEAAECVVATAFGNTYGLSETEQLEAIRMAARSLEVELRAVKRNVATDLGANK